MRQFRDESLVIATHNAGKLHEIGSLLAPYRVKVLSAATLGLAAPEETEETFAGNARIKAHSAASETGLPALSDDSGIVVAALGGAPGVHTADWAETPNGRDFPMAMKKLWSMLEKCRAPEPRLASFVCTLCLAWPDGHDEVFEGNVDGRLVWPMRGTRGFGFDPIFQPSGHTQTFGELEPSIKESISHRTRAFTKLVTLCFA